MDHQQDPLNFLQKTDKETVIWFLQFLLILELFSENLIDISYLLIYLPHTPLDTLLEVTFLYFRNVLHIDENLLQEDQNTFLFVFEWSEIKHFPIVVLLGRKFGHALGSILHVLTIVLVFYHFCTDGTVELQIYLIWLGNVFRNLGNIVLVVSQDLCDPAQVIIHWHFLLCFSTVASEVNTQRNFILVWYFIVIGDQQQTVILYNILSEMSVNFCTVFTKSEDKWDMFVDSIYCLPWTWIFCSICLHVLLLLVWTLFNQRFKCLKGFETVNNFARAHFVHFLLSIQ